MFLLETSHELSQSRLQLCIPAPQLRILPFEVRYFPAQLLHLPLQGSDRICIVCNRHCCGVKIGVCGNMVDIAIWMVSRLDSGERNQI